VPSALVTVCGCPCTRLLRVGQPFMSEVGAAFMVAFGAGH
jgi:hypothetical protein